MRGRAPFPAVSDLVREAMLVRWIGKSAPAVQSAKDTAGAEAEPEAAGSA